MNAINSVVIVWCASFDTQNQILALPQIDAFRNWRRTTGKDRKFQEWSQTHRREYIHVAVHVAAVHRDQQISRRSGKRIKMIRQPRVTKIARADHGIHFICADGDRGGDVS